MPIEAGSLPAFRPREAGRRKLALPGSYGLGRAPEGIECNAVPIHPDLRAVRSVLLPRDAHQRKQQYSSATSDPECYDHPPYRHDRPRRGSASGPISAQPRSCRPYAKRLGRSRAPSCRPYAKGLGGVGHRLTPPSPERTPRAGNVMRSSTARNSLSGGDVDRLFVVQLIAFHLPRIANVRWNIKVPQRDSQREADDCGGEVRLPR